MRIFDFICYYLAMWFEIQRKYSVSGTSVQRAGTALGIIVFCWMLSIEFAITRYIFKHPGYVALFIHLAVAFGLVLLFQHIYDTKGRYYYIKSPAYKEFTMEENAGIISALLISISSIFLPWVILILSTK